MWKGSTDNLTKMDKIVDVNYKSYVQKIKFYEYFILHSLQLLYK
jgi:hypothetical protein